MKVLVKIDPDLKEEYVEINCNSLSQEVSDISSYIENYGLNIVGRIKNEKYFIALKDIFYFEAVDNKVFAYTEDLIYEVSYKISTILSLFNNTSFIQTNRTMILNIDKIDKVSSLINGRILALLSNGEKQIISRAYAQDFKNKLKMK